MPRLAGAIRDGLTVPELSMHAWAQVTGQTTAAISGSQNVSSLSDNGVGDFTVTWAIPFDTASSYAILLTSSYGGSTITHEFQACQTQAAASARTLFRNYASQAASDPDLFTIGAVGEF